MSSKSLQKSYGTSAAPQRYLQQGSGFEGQALAELAARGGQLEVLVAVVDVVVAVRQEQADERRESGQGLVRGVGIGELLW